MPQIKCHNLTKVFRLRDQSYEAIRDLNFEVDNGELVAVVGKTGCGKSTTLNILLGLEWPTQGTLTIDGREPYNDFDFFRGKLSAVFQTDRLLPWRTVLDNATYGLEILRIARRMKDEDGIEALVLAGTELPLLLRDSATDIQFLDTTVIHVEAIVDELLR